MSWLQTLTSRLRSPGILVKFFGFGLLLVFLTASAMSRLLIYAFDEMDEKHLEPIAAWAVGEAYAAGDSRDAFLQRVYDQARARLTLFDAQGNPLASTKNPYPPLDSAAVSAVRKAGLVDQEDQLAIAIVQDGQFVGYGLIGFVDDTSVEIGMAELLGVLAVIGLAAWPIARSLTSPIRRMSTAVAAFGEGNLDARVPDPGVDEIGRLGRAFNSMAARVQDSRRSERLLLAAVSHELRTPLQRVRLAVELAADTQKDDPRLTAVMADLDDLDGILADVLAYARLEADSGAPGKDLLRIEPIPAHEFLADCAVRFESSFPARTLRWTAAPDLPVIHADARLLRRAIANLLSNAARYSPPDAPIGFVGRIDGDMLALEVTDEGPGIPEGQRDAILQPFFRGDEARSTRGSGLGLPIVKRIAEAHGGRVELHTSPAGSTFRVVIPAAGT